MNTGLIPTKYRDAKFASLPTAWRKDLQEAETAIREKRAYGVMLEGANGVGKTYAACAFARRLERTHAVQRYPLFVRATSIRTLWWEYDDFRERQWRKSLQDHPLLIVDDFGKEDRTNEYNDQKSLQIMGDLLRARVQSERITILTTNISHDNMEEVYGASVFSLLHEACGCWFAWSGEDRRRARA